MPKSFSRIHSSGEYAKRVANFIKFNFFTHKFHTLNFNFKSCIMQNKPQKPDPCRE